MKRTRKLGFWPSALAIIFVGILLAGLGSIWGTGYPYFASWESAPGKITDVNYEYQATSRGFCYRVKLTYSFDFNKTPFQSSRYSYFPEPGTCISSSQDELSAAKAEAIGKYVTVWIPDNNPASATLIKGISAFSAWATLIAAIAIIYIVNRLRIGWGFVGKSAGS